MTIDTVFAIYGAALGLVTAVMIGGFGLIFTELHRLSGKIDAIPAAFATLRRELAQDLQTQRAEAAAQTAALANVIVAARS